MTAYDLMKKRDEIKSCVFRLDRKIKFAQDYHRPIFDFSENEVRKLTSLLNSCVEIIEDNLKHR